MSDFQDGYNWALFSIGVFDQSDNSEYRNMNALSSVIDYMVEHGEDPGMKEIRTALIDGWHLGDKPQEAL